MNWKLFGGITLLIADDDAFNRQLIVTLLAKIPSIKVIEVENGIEAIEVLSYEKIDMLLLDFHMPKMNGEETLKFIRKEPRYDNIPISIITTDESHVKKLYALGVDDFISKPFDLKNLESRIYKQIEKHKVNKSIQKEKPTQKPIASKEKSYSLKEVENSQKEMFYGMSLIYNQKNNSSSNKIVATISKEFALLLGYNREIATNFYYAVLIRDIGAMNNKEELFDYKFTDKERERYNKNMLMGYQVVNNSIETNLIKIAKRVIVQRREHYDGLGFPQQLKGNEISKFAYMVAIVEMFDALLSPRIYRERKYYSQNEAYLILEQESGKKFDPDILKIFLSHFDMFIKLREELKLKYATRHTKASF
ncbi:MAG: response regulator [Epsilonproteobacteria bacterium]|nr:response regulator [Campylobacterota bacterium]